MTEYWVTKVLNRQWLKNKVDICRSVWASLRDPDGMCFSLWRQCRSTFVGVSITGSPEECVGVSGVQLKSTPASITANRISLDSDSHSLQLVSRSGWLLSSSLCMLVIGFLLLCGGIFFLDHALTSGSLFWLIGGVTAIVGLLFLWIGFRSWGLRLEVRMAEDKLRVKRSFFDKPLYQHSVELPDADRIFAKRTSEVMGNDEMNSEYFSLVFRREGVTHQLAEGIDGRHAAETLLAQVQHWLEQHRKQFGEQSRQLGEA